MGTCPSGGQSLKHFTYGCCPLSFLRGMSPRPTPSHVHQDMQKNMESKAMITQSLHHLWHPQQQECGAHWELTIHGA